MNYTIRDALIDALLDNDEDGDMLRAADKVDAILASLEDRNIRVMWNDDWLHDVGAG